VRGFARKWSAIISDILYITGGIYLVMKIRMLCTLQSISPRVSVQGVKSLGGHFACLCREFDFYEVKKNIIIFQKEKVNTFTLLIIFIVKSLQKEHNSTNLLL
jgi:hypothetical protein